MKIFKITYKYVITIIKTGEIEIESETALNKTRWGLSYNQRGYDLYDTSNKIDESKTFEIDDVQVVSNG